VSLNAKGVKIVRMSLPWRMK